MNSDEKEINAIKPEGKFHFADLLARSYVVWAIIALLAIDLICKISWDKLRIDHYASANRSMVWWAVDDFRKQKKDPDVVLLGSSLLMHVLHGGDAEYLKLPQNEVLHHKAAMLEDLLRRKTGVQLNTFAFALAGQMASDAYVLSSTLFVEHKPKAIIYGIAPRDLMDNMLESPASTEIFRFMSKLGGAGDCAWEAHAGLWEKIEYLCERASAIYDHRHYFVYLQQRYARSLLHPFGFKFSDAVHTPFALRRLALLDLPEDIGNNERIALPNLKPVYTDNREEYWRRYQPFKEKKFREQLAYLEKFMSFCDRQGIELVLVNMPLTEDNLKLMPGGTYDLYRRNVVALAGKYQARFIDLQDSSRFKKDYYCDTAHMNGAGGVEFFKALSEKLTDGSRLAFGRTGSWQ